ncbi:MAG: MarR family transcriptional regulator [Acidobacteria bacterium]|nr:MarR family transcriptional regulator [Acidobacteriota bacterium]
MKQTDSKKVDYEALAEFRHSIRRFLTFSEQAARTAGIEPQQHQALLAIKGLPPNQRATIGTLASRLQIRHHSAVGLSDRLEAKGFIRRIRCPEDHREMMLHLTLRGEQALRRLSLLHRTELRSAGPSLLRTLLALVPQAGIAGSVRRKSASKRPLPQAPKRALRSGLSLSQSKR